MAQPVTMSKSAAMGAERRTELSGFSTDKIFKDCQSCPRLHRCDEVAMVRGRIPRVSILGARRDAQELVRLSG